MRKLAPLDAAIVEYDTTSSYGRSSKDLPSCQRDLVVNALLDGYRKQNRSPSQKLLGDALCWTARQAMFDIVKRLLDDGVDVNTRGQYEQTPLLAVLNWFNIGPYEDNRSAGAETRRRKLDVVKLLLARGANPNLSDRHGNALWYASEHLKDRELIELLNNAGREAATPGSQDAAHPSGK